MPQMHYRHASLCLQKSKRVQARRTSTARVSFTSMDALVEESGLPVRNMLHPMMGMKNMDVLDTNLKGRFKWNSVKMSCSHHPFNVSTAAEVGVD
jgi:hypothetical protein